MAFDIQRRNFQPIQTTKRNIPLEQILAVQGQNPIAQGIDTAGNVLGKAMAQRLALQQQGQQIAQLAKLSGQEVPTDNALTPELYEKGLAIKDAADAKRAALANARVDREFALEKLRAGTSEYDPATGKTITTPGVQGLSIQYDAAGNPTIARNPNTYKSIVKPAKSGGAGDGTLVQSGLFDETGQPIMVNNKSGQSQTISLPKGTIGKTQTKTQLTPTAQTRASGEFAATVIPHIQDFKGQIALADKAGYLGPLAGRYQQFMTGKIGSTGNPQDDYMLGKLKSTRDFLASATMKAHVGSKGGGDMLEHFLSDMDTGKQSAAVLQGELDGLLPFMQGYVEAGKGGNVFKSAPLSGKQKSLADKLGL